MELYTDALGTIGYGGYFNWKWIQGQWLSHMQLNNITGINIEWQDPFPMVVACAICYGTPIFPGNVFNFGAITSPWSLQLIRVIQSTIKLYLGAVRNLHILCGHGAPVLGKLLLKKILWGILRYQGQSRILRQPVTPRVLLAIRSILRRWVGERDFTLIWAAVTLAFFAFLRCSEFTCRGTTSYSPGFYLSATSVSFEPNLACSQRMSVFLQ